MLRRCWERSDLERVMLIDWNRFSAASLALLSFFEQASRIEGRTRRSSQTVGKSSTYHSSERLLSLSLEEVRRFSFIFWGTRSGEEREERRRREFVGRRASGFSSISERSFFSIACWKTSQVLPRNRKDAIYLINPEPSSMNWAQPSARPCDSEV